jgi:hypothetical protein
MNERIGRISRSGPAVIVSAPEHRAACPALRWFFWSPPRDRPISLWPACTTVPLGGLSRALGGGGLTD